MAHTQSQYQRKLSLYCHLYAELLALILQYYELIIKLDLYKYSWDAVCIRLASRFMQVTKTHNYMPAEVGSTVSSFFADQVCWWSQTLSCPGCGSIEL